MFGKEKKVPELHKVPEEIEKAVREFAFDMAKYKELFVGVAI